MLSSFDELKQFVCSDIVKALAAYAYIEPSKDHVYTNVVYTLRFLGLSGGSAEELYNELDRLIGTYLKTYSYEEAKVRKEKLKGIICDCLNKLNIIEEAKRRISDLNGEERKILQIAALGIMKRAERLPRAWDILTLLI